MRIFLVMGLVCCLFGSTDDTDTTAPVAPTVPTDTLPKELGFESSPNGFEELPPFPESNPYSAVKVQLGRKLFFDPILSSDNSVACASCHRPEVGFADTKKIAVGISGKTGTRNVPTILNRGFGTIFTWDGKAETLESQVETPLTNPNEMGNESVDAVVGELKQQPHYVEAFANVFAEDAKPSPAAAVTQENLSKAIAAFERVLIYGDTKVDRFRSAEYEALSREARQGMWIFESRGGCWKCHGGENFADDQFHNTGVGFGDAKRDLGRFDQSEQDEDKFKFKTPTLRGVEFTAPYFHDGSKATLKEVVEFYNEGGAPDDPLLDKDMKPLKLSEEEVGFLVEFLKALSQ